MNIGLTIIRFNYRNNVLQKAQTALFNKQKTCAFIFKYRKKTEIKSISVFNSPSWVRTNDPSVNSRMLCRWAIEDYPEDTYIPSKSHTAKSLPSCSSFSYLLGYALDRLVTVSSVHYCTSTSVLSTLSSSRGLTTCVGISHLEGGFTLRCLQRLSLPDLATLPCLWQDNRYTSGRSSPVLSY